MGGVNEEGQKVSFFTESLNPAVKPQTCLKRA
jgi:hypothetical protein